MYGSHEERERLARFAKLGCRLYFSKEDGTRGVGLLYHDVPYRR